MGLRTIAKVIALCFSPIYANSAGLCSSFKAEALTGIHAMGPGTGVPARTAGVADVFKMALFAATASRTVADTVYNTTGELAASGNYTQGGVTLTMANAPSVSSTQGIFTPSQPASWTNLTSSAAFDCAVMYNSSQGNKEVAVFTFSSQNIAAGNFNLTMPANASSTALIRYE